MALCSERPFPALHGAVGTPGRCETLGHAILQRPNPSLRRRPPYFCPVLLLVQMGGEYLGARYPSPKKEIRPTHKDSRDNQQKEHWLRKGGARSLPRLTLLPEVTTAENDAKCAD